MHLSLSSTIQMFKMAETGQSPLEPGFDSQQRRFLGYKVFVLFKKCK